MLGVDQGQPDVCFTPGKVHTTTANPRELSDTINDRKGTENTLKIRNIDLKASRRKDFLKRNAQREKKKLEMGFSRQGMELRPLIPILRRQRAADF